MSYSEDVDRKILKNRPALRERRKWLRNNQTGAEEVLWYHLKHTQLGFKFRRQYSFGPYIIDFYCTEKKLGIEVDGLIHLLTEAEYNYRTRTLQYYGITIIRFTNLEIMNHIDYVIQKILNHLK